MNKLRRRAMENRQKKGTPIKSVLVIDNHNLMFRCIHVAYKHDIMDDNFTYWKYLIMNQLTGFVNKFNPDRLIIAIDDKDYWRKRIYPEYKAHRSESRAKSTVDFEKFFPVAMKFYDDLEKAFPNIMMLKVGECEADDIIAVLTNEIVKKPITVVTTDKDMYQLMKQTHYQQFDPIKGKIVTSLNPQKDLDVKIVMGDRSDNITAIRPRVGAATALKIINEGLEAELEDVEVKERYIRNRQLIDFDYIPTDIVESIKDAYNETEVGAYDGGKVFNFLMANKLGMFLDTYQSSIQNLKELR